MKEMIGELAQMAEEEGTTLFCVAGDINSDKQILAGAGTGGEIATLTGLGLVHIIQKLGNGDEKLTAELTLAIAKVVGRIMSESVAELDLGPDTDPQPIEDIVPDGAFVIEDQEKKVH